MLAAQQLKYPGENMASGEESNPDLLLTLGRCDNNFTAGEPTVKVGDEIVRLFIFTYYITKIMRSLTRGV